MKVRVAALYLCIQQLWDCSRGHVKERVNSTSNSGEVLADVSHTYKAYRQTEQAAVLMICTCTQLILVRKQPDMKNAVVVYIRQVSFSNIPQHKKKG